MPRSIQLIVAFCTLALLIGASGADETATRTRARITLAQAASEATELRLRSAIEKIQSGEPNYDEMQPLLRAAVKNQYSVVQPKLASMGKIKSIEFVGNQNGQDIFNVTFENGSLAWGIQLTADGKITALFFN